MSWLERIAKYFIPFLIGAWVGSTVESHISGASPVGPFMIINALMPLMINFMFLLILFDLLKKILK